MSSIKYWNPKFAIQNMKKSKGVLTLFLGMFPILNFLVLLLLFRESNSTVNLTTISILQFIGMYIIPFIVGISLFHYLFKRKSVDFIGSMPLSRKTIYVTNVITGLGLLALFILINTAFLFFASMLANYALPFSMILDYFLIWLVTYFFVFSVSMIAISISGNVMTTIAVSMLLFFLVPFLHAFAKAGINQTGNFYIECNHQACLPENYSCDNIESCEKKERENQYQLHSERMSSYVYTMPYENFHQIIFFNSDKTLFEVTAFGKMIVLGLGSLVLSFFLFSRRKLENTETSFKNYWVHSFVKGLTMIPFLTLIYEVLIESEDSLLVFFVLLCILIGYFFLYDIITRKGIGKWKDSILAFFLIVSIGGVLIVSLDHMGSSRVFKEKEIDKLVFDIYPSGYPTEADRIYELTIKNKELISKILSVSLDQKKTNPSSYDNSYYMNTYAYFNDSVVLYYYAYLDEEVGKDLLSAVKQGKEYQEERKIDFSDVYGIEVGNQFVSEGKEGIPYIKEAYESTTTQDAAHEEIVVFHVYRDGKPMEKEVSTKQSKKLQSWVEKEFEKRNQEVYQEIKKEMQEESQSYLLWVDYETDNKDNLLGEYEEYDMYELNKWSKEGWLSFLEKYHEEKVSFEKPVLVLRINNQRFYTNKIEEAKKVLADAIAKKDSQEPVTPSTTETK